MLFFSLFFYFSFCLIELTSGSKPINLGYIRLLLANLTPQNTTYTHATSSELASNDDQTSNNSNSTTQGMLDAGRVVTVRDLLKGLYEKACQQKLWGLVRHTAGMLGKRVEDLAKAMTDLLVRQKQVSLRYQFIELLSLLQIFRSGYCWNAANKRIYCHGAIARDRIASTDSRGLRRR